MMKKKYMVPHTEVVDIKLESRLLAGSAVGTDILNGETGDMGLSRENEELLFGEQSDVFNTLLK